MIPENGIENILERSQFNKRRRKLFAYTELIRTNLNDSFIEFKDTLWLTQYRWKYAKWLDIEGPKYVKSVLIQLLATWRFGSEHGDGHGFYDGI